MKHVDCLSRQPVVPAPGEDKYVDDTTKFIGAVQQEDPKRREIEEILNYLNSENNVGCPELDFYKRLKLKDEFVQDNKLYLREGQQVLTKHQANEVMMEIHCGPEACHFRFDRTLGAFNIFFYHPKAAALAKHMIRTCHTCQVTKVRVSPPRAANRTTSSTKPNGLIGIDFMGLLHGLEGNSYLLTLTDHYTKFLTAIPKRADIRSYHHCFEKLLPGFSEDQKQL